MAKTGGTKSKDGGEDKVTMRLVKCGSLQPKEPAEDGGGLLGVLRRKVEHPETDKT